jgi:hypothetical protein
MVAHHNTGLPELFSALVAYSFTDIDRTEHDHPAGDRKHIVYDQLFPGSFHRDQVLQDQSCHIQNANSHQEDHKGIDRKKKIPEGYWPSPVPALVPDQQVKKPWKKGIGDEYYGGDPYDSRNGNGLKGRVFGEYQHPYPDKGCYSTEKDRGFV